MIAHYNKGKSGKDTVETFLTAAKHSAPCVLIHANSMGPNGKGKTVYSDS